MPSKPHIQLANRVGRGEGQRALAIAMSIVELRDRLNEIIADHENMGCPECNKQPVVFAIRQPRDEHGCWPDQVRVPVRWVLSGAIPLQLENGQVVQVAEMG